MKNSLKSYYWLSNINSQNFSKKSVVLIGAGGISSHYAQALTKLKIKDVSIISRSNSSKNLSKQFGFKSFTGGYEKNLSTLNHKDLVIIAIDVSELTKCAETVIKTGCKNILIEKPGSLFSSNLQKLEKKISNQNIRIAYNRTVYPNIHKLKELITEDGGITSCKFSITERVHSFSPILNDTFKFWGLSNSLHVLSIVKELIGYPKILNPIVTGKFPWHPSGSVFVGSGMSENDIPFSYHGDWNSSGGWAVEIMTSKYTYKLNPLEKLFRIKKSNSKIEEIPFKMAFKTIKQGIAEELAIMLSGKNLPVDLIDLKQGSKLINFGQKIFGYPKK
jgi:predicted dehydrogenase